MVVKKESFAKVSQKRYTEDKYRKTRDFEVSEKDVSMKTLSVFGRLLEFRILFENLKLTKSKTKTRE